MASNEIEHKRAQAFIFEALHLDTHFPAAATVQQMREEDWDYLLKIAGEHRLGAMLHNRLKRDDLASAIPERVLRYLKAAYRKSALRSLVVYRELAKVTRLLEAAHIPSIALKGAYLARFAYPDPALRPMRDIDLLLKPEQATKAFELLKGYGYCLRYATQEGLPSAFLECNEHLPTLISPDGVVIELHHRLFDLDANKMHLADFSHEIWERSVVITSMGMKIRFLGIEDLLLHLCVHATIKHHFNLGALALTDVVLLIETHAIDWQVFLNRVSAGDWQRCALALLHLAKRNLGAKIPNEVIDKLSEKDSSVAWLENAEYLLFAEFTEHRLLGENYYKVLYSGTFLERITALVRIVFPFRSYIALSFPVDANSPKVLLYYPLRWYRLLFKNLPLVCRPFSSKKESIRPLAQHKVALNHWLHEKPPH